MQDDTARSPSRRRCVHALRNHLGVILGIIELLLEEMPDGDSRRADLLEARSSASEAARLVAAEFNVEE